MNRSSGQPEYVADLGPRVVLVANVSDRAGQPIVDLALQAGEQMHRDRGVAESVQSAKRAQEATASSATSVGGTRRSG